MTDAPKPEPKELNPRQIRFALEYAIDGNGTQAAIRAGYSAPTAAECASRLLTKRKIKDLVDKNRAIIQAKATWGAAQTRQAVIVHALDSDPKVSLKALDQLAKIDGMYSETRRLEYPNGPPTIAASISLETMTPEQFKAFCEFKSTVVKPTDPADNEPK